jgi:hypothetical protein
MRRLPSSWNRTMAKLGLRKRQSQRLALAQRIAKLGFEKLEDRRVLATITVTSTAGVFNADSFLSFPEAIEVLRTGDKNQSINDGTQLRDLTEGEKACIQDDDQWLANTIRFEIAVPGVIGLTSAQYINTHSVVIDGDNQGRRGIIIDGAAVSGLDGILYMGGGIDLTIKNLTIRNGKNIYDRGGAIEGRGNLTVQNVPFENNSGGMGGAINWTDGLGNTLTIDSCEFINNNSLVSPELGYGFGGAVYAWVTDAGNVHIDNSVFLGNRSLKNGGAVAIYSGADAVYNNPEPLGSNIKIEGSTFSDNEAGAFDDGELYGDGGAIYYRSMSSDSSSGNNSILFDRLSISSNKAKMSGGGISIAMNLDIYNFTVPITISQCSIINNTALGVDGSADNLGYGGGGIAYVAEGTSQGRAALDIVNTTISGNVAANGGGLLIEGGGAIRHSTIAYNRLTTFLDEGVVNEPYRSGGGVLLRRLPSSPVNLPSFSHSIVARNTGGSGPNFGLRYEDWPEVIFGGGVVPLNELCLVDTPFPNYYLPLDFSYSIIDDRKGPLERCGEHGTSTTRCATGKGASCFFSPQETFSS